MNPDIEQNAREIRDRVWKAADAAGREPEEITVIAVSKTFDRSLMDDAYELGFRDFGESRVQEIRAKCEIPLPEDARLHMIGPLQTNKVRQLLPHIQMLQTVDRLRLVEALAAELEKQDAHLRVMLQINVSGEHQKSGTSPDETETLLEELLKYPRIQPIGFMTMAPYGAEEAELRSVFGGLRMLREQLQQFHSIALPDLSMGMSDDFAIAIAEGATHIRIGRALFGSR